MRYTVKELCTKKENQIFDRKSARKDAKRLSNHIVAFANADGGTIVIGVEDNGDITRIDAYTNNVNEILRVPFDYCAPSIRVMTETVDCIDKDGKQNHLLIITIPQSSELHANQQDEVYYRMGDKSHRLKFDERLQLMYAKGSRYYEDEPVFRSSLSKTRFFPAISLTWFGKHWTLCAGKERSILALVRTDGLSLHPNILSSPGGKSLSMLLPTVIIALKAQIFRSKCLMIGLLWKVPGFFLALFA